MKPATLVLWLIGSLMTSGCIFHHTETIPSRHEQQDERTRPEGVAMTPEAADTGTAR
jgi:hypothetical protein